MSNTTQQQTNSHSPSTAKTSTHTRGSSTGKPSRTTNKVGHGKSKYANKARGKKFVKPAPKPRGPVNTYTSVCCGVPATKKPCVAVGKKDALVQGLGKFRCTGCKKRSAVTVSKFKAPEAVVVAPPVAEVSVA